VAAPVDSARQATNQSTGATDWNINVGSPVADTLLIVFIRIANAAATITSFTGYTQLAEDISDASDDRTAVYYRWADGTEGATNLFVISTAVKGAAICWEVTGARNEAPPISAVAVGTTGPNTASSNVVTPLEAPQDTLYITMAGGDGEVGAYTAAPTNYINLIAANSGTGGAAGTNVFCGGASREVLGSSSGDAPAFTHGAHVAGWTAFAVAIRPPGPAADIAYLSTARVRW
jgi:hypothetical protein